MKTKTMKRPLKLNRVSLRRLTGAQAEAVLGGGATGNGDCWLNTAQHPCHGRTGAAAGCAAGSGWQDCGFNPGG